MKIFKEELKQNTMKKMNIMNIMIKMKIQIHKKALKIIIIKITIIIKIFINKIIFII
jgi:hypothetical protein